MAKTPKKLSAGEEEFALHCATYKIDVVREYIFWVGRKWRFDFCIPDAKIAIEIEGGIWNGGRHTRGTGFEKDCEKYAHAAFAGYRVFRPPSGMVHSGVAIDYLRKALA